MRGYVRPAADAVVLVSSGEISYKGGLWHQETNPPNPLYLQGRVSFLLIFYEIDMIPIIDLHLGLCMMASGRQFGSETSLSLHPAEISKLEISAG